MNYTEPKRRIRGMFGLVTDKTPVTFGKFVDWKVGDVPAWYLIWVWNNRDTRDGRFPPMREKHPGLIDYIEKNLKRLEDEYEADQEKRKAEGKTITTRTRET